MTDRRLDVLAIGNAIVDVIADADDEFLAREKMHKGAMRLIDEEEATRLYAEMGPARELSGGSAANTVAGVASLGLNAGFIGQLGDDQLGAIFAHDIRGPLNTISLHNYLVGSSPAVRADPEDGPGLDAGGDVPHVEEAADAGEDAERERRRLLRVHQDPSPCCLRSASRPA